MCKPTKYTKILENNGFGLYNNIKYYCYLKEVKILENSIGNINQVKYGKIRVDIDDKLRIISASRGFYELSGFSYNDVQGNLSLKDLFKGDNDATNKFFKAVMRNLEKR